MSIIPKERWINHYKNIWNDLGTNEEQQDNKRIEVDHMEMTEL